MELKAGYKQTEVGIIPEDWEVKRLGEVSSFRTGPFGSALHKSDYTYDGVPIINPMHIVDGQLIPSLAMSITEDTAKRLSDFRLSNNEIIIGRRGDMGRCAVVRENNIGWLCGTGSMIVRTNVSVNPEFIQLILASPEIIAAITETSVGSTMINLNQSTLSNIKIKCPPTEEQTAIASALSDMDALLDGLDRLITKKRNLKQAAMQQLLTGKTRLAGFEGEWEVKRLGDHVTFLRNGVNSRAELTYSDSVKYLHYGDIHASTAMQLSPENLPTLPSDKAKTLDRLNDGDLIFADASEDINGVSKSVEIYGISNIELVSGLHTIAARFDKNILADGFKAYLQFCPDFSSHLRRLAAGTKVYATNRSHIASVEMKLPNVKEQEAIAAVLADMDAEIAALEQRRTKTRDIKQGMMQELLTGRTRLV
jgi:type I restriction enzyme S subunit